MRIYPITSADVAMLKEWLSLNKEDGTLLWRKKICKKVVIGAVAGRTRKDGYSDVQVNKRRFLVHRVVYAFIHGDCIGEIDHIDGNMRNNCPSNLRIVTRSQQNMNKKPSKKNILGFRGVYLHAPTGLYNARICFNNERVSLGYFKTCEEAHAAYLSGVEKYHGEYRRAY
jgi:hypothetical protein